MSVPHHKLDESASKEEEDKAATPQPPKGRHRSQNSSFDVQADEPAETEDIEAGMPLGRMCTACCLLTLGIALLIIGFVKEAKARVPAEGVPFWVIGCLVLVPGGYCAYELLRAYRAKTPIERRRILNEIPDF